MPSSYPQSILNVLQAITTVKPKSVLDIGFGRGKYGFLIKEYFPEVKIDGMEVHEPYITQLQKEIYEKIYVENVLETDIQKYDLYLLIDIIEHWEKDEVYTLLKKLLEKGSVIISTPNSFIPQGDVNGNHWETHKSYWTYNDFKDYKTTLIPNTLSLILILWQY